MTMKEKAMSFLILFCLIVPTAFSLSFMKRKKNQYKEFGEGGASSFYRQNYTWVAVDIKRVRMMTVNDEPTFYFKIYVNGKDSIYWPQNYTGDDAWFERPRAWGNISYNPEELVNIQIQVWENKVLIDEHMDISRGKSPFAAGKTVNLFYDLETGEWTGDDHLDDGNGYGHCSSFEDGNEEESDCEIWFDVYQYFNGSYEDHLTYWELDNLYHVNISKSYAGEDVDGDGISSEWEDKYGYDPFTWDNHTELDPDEDGLDNVEEWKTSSQWLSDPFAKEIFMEVDGMQSKRPFGKPYIFPKESQQLLCNAFARHNITVIIDDGTISGGGDLIPFDESMIGRELQAARFKYFLNEDENNWKKGVFHYAIIGCQMEWFSRPAGGRAFEVDSHFIGGQYVRNWAWMFYLQGSNYYKAFASVFMHELGHTLGLNRFEGIDNENSRFPWNEEFWEWGPYKSCMNYRYVYKLVDYSNGDDDDHDQNDWEIIDLTRINRASW